MVLSCCSPADFLLLWYKHSQNLIEAEGLQHQVVAGLAAVVRLNLAAVGLVVVTLENQAAVVLLVVVQQNQVVVDLLVVVL